MVFDRIPLKSGLYVIATPLGNARDITLRALDVLASADILVAEDTRTLRKLLQIHGIPVENRKIMAFHDYSGTAQINFILGEIASGKSVALTSDAGTPLISDPGFELVAAIRDAGHDVTAAPGPSALTAALSIAGAATDRFAFHGFLPSQIGKRETEFLNAKSAPHPIVYYESPKRLTYSLGQIAEICGDDRQVIVCRELTKKFEDVRSGPVSDVKAHYETTPAKGEIVLILCPATSDDTSQDDIDTALLNALLTHRVKDAAALVAGAFNLPKRDIYQRALTLTQKDG